MFDIVEALLWPLVRLFDGRFDHRRIRHFFEERGVRVQTIQWSPFSTGWFSNWYDRFYLVEYETGSGASGTITCRTSWRTGVVISDDDEEFGESGATADEAS